MYVNSQMLRKHVWLLLSNTWDNRASYNGWHVGSQMDGMLDTKYCISLFYCHRCPEKIETNNQKKDHESQHSSLISAQSLISGQSGHFWRINSLCNRSNKAASAEWYRKSQLWNLIFNTWEDKHGSLFSPTIFPCITPITSYALFSIAQIHCPGL